MEIASSVAASILSGEVAADKEMSMIKISKVLIRIEENSFLLFNSFFIVKLSPVKVGL
jgi:hypothetical protein